MRIFMSLVLTLLSVAVCADGVAATTTPVKRIAIYVIPYYQSAENADGAPRVNVAKAYDARLASNRPEDIVSIRDDVMAHPELITPMTMMVLAVRLYDVGLRDDSVFWFYAAKNRYVTMASVLDMKSSALSQAEDATRNFTALAGPVINSYAFCDLEKQRATKSRAIAWVEEHPYKVLFLEQLPAVSGDRKENLKQAITRLRDGAEAESQYLADSKNLEQFKKQRDANHVAEQFCWGL